MDIYKDIEARTDGEIYMGVVGPVRTGKSTFIKRFMELMVIPAIDDENNRMRAKDELPQSATGKTVMTTEPKFIPKEAVNITVGDGIKLKCRLIDCVGYMVNGAEGHEEDGHERLVKTPWYDYDIPFTKAAELGTKKVIFDHSTVGIVVSCDGSITDIPRDSYIEAEKRTVTELKEIGKPFIMLLNSVRPQAPETKELAQSLCGEYGVEVLPVNCDQLKSKDINKIFESLLMDFPVTAINFNIPKWVEAVDCDNPIKDYMIKQAKADFKNIYHMRDIYHITCDGDEYIEKIDLSNINMADGTININVVLFDKYYYDMLSATLGCEIRSEYDFIREITQLAKTKKQCEKVSEAYLQSCSTGYGTVSPDEADIRLDA
ncbi:MAG: stage IV sporulation protein A, partial [Ruminococcus sp.]|nr:stage IV sporulation protein A [Ruminococcus sp.]